MNFSSEHFCEPLMENPTYFSKKMFGGLAIYCNDLMLFVLTEGEGDTEWRGQKFDFELWNGTLVCTSREHHPSLKKDFAGLQEHPILGKWLYLPSSSPHFESDFQELVERAERQDPRIGIVPGQKKRKKKKSAKKPTKKKAASKKAAAKTKKKKKVAKKGVKKVKKKASSAARRPSLKK